MAAIGGDNSCHLLPLLDFDLIAENPKILMGFSAITLLNVAIWCETGLVTLNGPCLLTDFAEYPEMLEYTLSAFLRAVCEPRPIGWVMPSSWWTEEYLDWRTKKDLERARAGVPSAGWAWLKNGVAEGVLVGGCLESLQHLRRTRFWPSFQNAILFVETSGDAPAPARVDGMLMDYENMGVFSQLAGLLVGRPMGYSPVQRRELRGVVLERTHRFSFPVIMEWILGTRRRSSSSPWDAVRGSTRYGAPSRSWRQPSRSFAGSWAGLPASVADRALRVRLADSLPC